MSVAPTTKSNSAHRPPAAPMEQAEAARPVYFGPEGRPLFGWLHSCPSPSLGLVICNPFGDEAVRAHRSIRHLAIRASSVGISTLRFDYDGTGDSAGHDLDPERFSQWLASIKAAADTLRQLSGVTRLCFAGIRLGATLAALAAADRTDVAGLVAIAPVVNGKAYLRELRLLRGAIDSKRDLTRNDAQTTLEIAGFLLGEDTQASLIAVDLLAHKRAAPRVLILDRAEMPSGEKWAEYLRSLGTSVDYSRVGGYPEMMLDSHESSVQEGIIAAASTWLQEVASHSSPAPPTADLQPPTPRTYATVAPSFVPDPAIDETLQLPIEEHAALFGGSANLFGIVSAPKVTPATRASSTAIILLNAGAVQHIGPERMYVALARHLAQLGYTVLRMDIASIGDSAPHPGQAEVDVYSPHALQDLGKAIEYLQRDWHAKAFVAAGLCSGAYHSFKAAVARYPLAQVLAINPLTFFWKAGMSLQYPDYRVAQDLRRYRSTALSRDTWRRLLGGRVDLRNFVRVLIRTAQARALGAVRALARLIGHPLSEDLPTEVHAVLRAAIDLQFVFSADDPGLDLLRAQGGIVVRRLRARDRIGVTLVEGANHTFTDLVTRRTLIRVLTGKIRSRLTPTGSLIDGSL